jgi:hypothetical protein
MDVKETIQLQATCYKIVEFKVGLSGSFRRCFHDAYKCEYPSGTCVRVGLEAEMFSINPFKIACDRKGPGTASPGCCCEDKEGLSKGSRATIKAFRL